MFEVCFNDILTFSIQQNLVWILKLCISLLIMPYLSVTSITVAQIIEKFMYSLVDQLLLYLSYSKCSLYISNTF